jgi:hypothetical protein
MKSRYSSLESVFDADHVIFWSNLSRLNNLMAFVNISMFFLTGLVAKGYFHIFYSNTEALQLSIPVIKAESPKKQSPALVQLKRLPGLLDIFPQIISCYRFQYPVLYLL